MPKIKIRNISKVTSDIDNLKDDPSIGYQYIPVFNFMEPNPKDDITFSGC